MEARKDITFCICFLILFPFCRTFDLEPKPIPAERSGNFSLSNSYEETFYVKGGITDSVGATLRIEAGVGFDAQLTCPIIFIIQQGEVVTSFYLPISITYDEGKSSYVHYNGARTLCFNKNENDQIDQNVRITISTCNKTGVAYHFTLNGSNNEYIQKNSEKTVEVTPTSPIYFPFSFLGNKNDIVLVEVRSNDNICMTVSVQSPQCPVADQEDTVNFKGKRRNYWQTMSTVSLMPIQAKDFPSGFVLVLVVNTDNARCKEYRGINPSKSEYSNTSEVARMDPKWKIISITIGEEMPHGEYVYPVFVPLGFYISLMALVVFLFTIFYQCTLCCMRRRVPEPPAYRVQYRNRTLNAASLETDTDSVSHSRSSIDSTSSNASRFSPTPLETDEIRFIRYRNNPTGPSAENRAPCVTDLVYAPSKHTETSRGYYWLMFTIAVFYSVPVFQLLSTYQQILLRTGDNDLCYYNYHCAHPLWKLVDFNHIYSNVGYILLGTFFIFLVYFKEKLRDQILENLRLANLNDLSPSASSAPVVHQPLERYGTMQNFGIYYSLGFALIMEGVLSAGYHICPNKSNFQFDTSFMYVIAVLYMVKIYQFRHPVRINATTTFAVLAIIAAVSVLGLLVAQLTVSIIFSVFHLFSVFYLQIYIYYIGFIKDEDGNIVTSHYKLVKIAWGKWKMMRMNDRPITWLRPHHRSRILLPIFTIPFNVGVMIQHFAVSSDFASHLLYIFIGNLLLYLTYYILMKLFHFEFLSCSSIQPLMYIPLTVLLWVFSLQYFNQNLTSWDKSPAESRQQNEECFLMDFYDYHDMWHFLSAGALFCSFMMLLTIEDALAEKRQSEIPVF